MRKGIIQGLHWNSRELNILISRETISFRRNSHCFLPLRNASHMFTYKTHRSPQTSPSFPHYPLPPFLILGNHEPLFHLYGDGVCRFSTVIFFKRFFKNVDHFKSLYWICYNIALGFFFSFDPEACGILAAWLGIELPPPALEGQALSSGQVGVLPNYYIINEKKSYNMGYFEIEFFHSVKCPWDPSKS